MKLNVGDVLYSIEGKITRVSEKRAFVEKPGVDDLPHVLYMFTREYESPLKDFRTLGVANNYLVKHFKLETPELKTKFKALVERKTLENGFSEIKVEGSEKVPTFRT